jgi:hypothetical protein
LNFIIYFLEIRMDLSFNAEAYRELEGHRLIITERLAKQRRQAEIERLVDMEVRQFAEKMADVQKRHADELIEEKLR